MSDAEFQTDRFIGIAEEAYREMISYEKQKDMTGVELIAAERLEHKIKHNHSIKADSEQYPDFQLGDIAEAVLSGDMTRLPDNCNMADVYLMVNKPYKDRLILAGALIAAQIDVLNFTE